MRLFLDPEVRPEFAKFSSPTKLSDSPDNWQKEIAAEVFKQVPFLADYSVNVVINRADPQRGYAHGSIRVSNKSEAPAKQQKKLPHLIVPIVVRDRVLMPLDIFLDGKKAWPLTEWRVREKLFRADAFELSERKPTDQNLSEQLYPPLRINARGLGAGSSGGFGKTAAIFGASTPGAISEDSVPFDVRKQVYQNYLSRKSQEDPSSPGLSAVVGGGLTGALGGGLGYMARGGKGALLGGAIGAGLGALGGYGLAKADAGRIRHAQMLQANPERVDPEMANAIYDLNEQRRMSEYMTDERRHRNQIDAMTSPRSHYVHMMKQAALRHLRKGR